MIDYIFTRVVEQGGIPEFFGVFFCNPEIHFCFDPEMPLKMKSKRKSISALIWPPKVGCQVKFSTPSHTFWHILHLEPTKLRSAASFFARILRVSARRASSRKGFGRQLRREDVIAILRSTAILIAIIPQMETVATTCDLEQSANSYLLSANFVSNQAIISGIREISWRWKIQLLNMLRQLHS
jgi:hypothetical protein